MPNDHNNQDTNNDDNTCANHCGAVWLLPGTFFRQHR